VPLFTMIFPLDFRIVLTVWYFSFSFSYLTFRPCDLSGVKLYCLNSNPFGIFCHRCIVELFKVRMHNMMNRILYDVNEI
jgi:hypothetical protein